jgi:predicted nucleotide-binding protein
MSNVVKIDECINLMSKEKLSVTVIKALTISKTLKDYYNWYLLKLLTMGVNTSAEDKQFVRSEFIALSLHEGVSREIIDIQISQAVEKYISAKTLDKDKIVSFSTGEIENLIDNYTEWKDTCKLPEGLAPVDLFYENRQREQVQLDLVIQNNQFRNVYSQIQFLVGDILSNMRITSLEQEKIKEKESNPEIIMENIFIIHGHSEAKRREICELLKDEFGLNPIILQEQPSQGMTIIEKFEKYAKTCSYAFAIFTPDDIVENNGVKYFQARPNVIFELGWFYAHLGRSKVCILDQESDKSEIFSDLQGVLRLQFKSDVKEKIIDIRKELRASNIID